MGKRKTTEEFIEDARKIHGDKYDYSKSEYKNAKTKITIICPKEGHGCFKQLPYSHIIGCGCPKCYIESKPLKNTKTTEQFIEDARKIHGDKYDYSKVDYVNCETKVCIICKKHNEFYQKPSKHLQGCGCPKCNGGVKMNQDWFIERSNEIHRNKYNYLLVNYKNHNDVIEIICPIHGLFKQKASNHLSGRGCPKCGNIQSSVKNTISQEEWIERAREVHGDKYDYSKTIYKHSLKKVKIGCSLHGYFTQFASLHLNGHGCPKCGKISSRITQSTTQEEWIERAREVHGDKYDYSFVNYINGRNKVIIKCNVCGNIFKQRADVHISGQNCPRCKESKLENQVKKLLDDNNIVYTHDENNFDWLKNKIKMRLDFYLPEYNVAIECQGQQHFNSFDFFGGEQGFKENLDRDLLKLRLCKEHNINILYYIDSYINVPEDWSHYEVIRDLNTLLEKIYSFKKC